MKCYKKDCPNDGTERWLGDPVCQDHHDENVRIIKKMGEEAKNAAPHYKSDRIHAALRGKRFY